MQAIITKILPATNTKPTRIKASCARGSLIASPTATHDYSKLETHTMVARCLAERFVDEDTAEFGAASIRSNPWGKTFVTGCLPSGDFAHVFVE